MATIIEQLSTAPAWENPAYSLAVGLASLPERGVSWAEVERRAREIDAALSGGRSEDRAILEAMHTLDDAEALAVSIVPLGF